MKEMRSGTCYRWLICAGFLLVFSILLSGGEEHSAKKVRWNCDRQGPIISAHYMPWFSNPHTSGASSPGWRHWNWNGKVVQHDPEVRDATGRRDIASTLYPLIGVYSSNRRSVIRYHMETAKAAGIDAFVVIWYGPGSETDSVIPLLLEVGAEVGIRVALCYEEKINWPDFRKPTSRADLLHTATNDLAYLIENYANHSSYLRRDENPVVFQFNFWGSDDLGPKNILPGEWSQIFAALPQEIAYVRQNQDEAFHPVIPGRYLWFTRDESLIETFARSSRSQMEAGSLRFFVAMAAPEFDDSGVNGWGEGSRVTPGAGLSLLADTLERAWRGDPEMIQLVTWNDFNEGSSIEPTIEHGFRYLDALETWVGEKTGRPIDLSDNRVSFFRYQESTSEAEKAEIPASAEEIVRNQSVLSVEIPRYLETIE